MSPNLSGAPAPTPEEIAQAESRLTDFHYAIFDLLPTEGMNVGLQPMVITIRLLTNKLNAAGGARLSSGSMMAELKVMEKFGLAIRVQKLSGHTLGWQKSRRAEELLVAYKQRGVADEAKGVFDEGAAPSGVFDEVAREALDAAESEQRPITPERAEDITRALEPQREGGQS